MLWNLSLAKHRWNVNSSTGLAETRWDSGMSWATIRLKRRTACSGVLTERLTIARLVKEITAFYGTKGSIQRSQEPSGAPCPELNGFTYFTPPYSIPFWYIFNIIPQPKTSLQRLRSLISTEYISVLTANTDELTAKRPSRGSLYVCYQYSLQVNSGQTIISDAFQ
jgi:hypothetical protein